MNLTLEKRERVTTGGKGRGENRGEAGEINGMVLQMCLPRITWEDSIIIIIF